MDASKLGNFISAQRKSLDMTQADLGKKIMVTDKAVSRWERGLGFPDINTLEPLAEALHVSVQELMQAEKNVTGEVSTEDASKAILNTIGVAENQLKAAEKKEIRISIIIIAVVAMMLLIIDNLKLSELGMTALFVYLPILCIIAGIVLLVEAIIRKVTGKPFKATLITAIVMISVLITLGVFLFICGTMFFPGAR